MLDKLAGSGQPGRGSYNCTFAATATAAAAAALSQPVAPQSCAIFSTKPTAAGHTASTLAQQGEGLGSCGGAGYRRRQSAAIAQRSPGGSCLDTKFPCSVQSCSGLGFGFGCCCCCNNKRQPRQCPQKRFERKFKFRTAATSS